MTQHEADKLKAFIDGMVDAPPTYEGLPITLCKPGGATSLNSHGTSLVYENTYPITVDYTQSFDDMVEAGKYDYVDSDAKAKNWPITGEGKQEHKAILVHFNKGMNSEEVLAYGEEHSLEPAKAEDLLAFGAQYPELQREFFIVALGSVWQFHGDRNVLVLNSFDGERYLTVGWFDGDWFGYCRFLFKKV